MSSREISDNARPPLAINIRSSSFILSSLLPTRDNCVYICIYLFMYVYRKRSRAHDRVIFPRLAPSPPRFTISSLNCWDIGRRIKRRWGFTFDGCTVEWNMRGGERWTFERVIGILVSIRGNLRKEDIFILRAIFLYISSLSTFKKLGLYDFLIGNRAREISFKIVVELSF